MASRGRFKPAAWTRDAAWMPPSDGHPEIRYRDPTQMGKVYLLPKGADRTVPGLGEGEIGPDVDDPALTLEAWRERIRRHPGELKNLLRNQAFVAGIGNAYSDEILHAARLLPFRKRSTLADEEIDALYAAARTTVGRRDRGAARAGPADVRDAGPGLPGGPHEGRPGVPALRDQDHRGQGRRLRHVVLPRLPALSVGQGSLRTWPTFRSRGFSMPLSSFRTATVVPNSLGDPTEGVATADLVGLRGRRPAGCLGRRRCRLDFGRDQGPRGRHGRGRASSRVRRLAAAEGDADAPTTDLARRGGRARRSTGARRRSPRRPRPSAPPGRPARRHVRGGGPAC